MPKEDNDMVVFALKTVFYGADYELDTEKESCLRNLIFTG